MSKAVDIERELRRDVAFSIVLAVGALLYAAVSGDAYSQRLVALAGCYAVIGVGYQRLFADLGVLSLAQGAFFAVGAYVVALASTQGGLDGLIALPAAMLASATLAFVILPPLLRLASHYMALATLAVAQLVLLAAVNFEDLTGGANGIADIPPFTLLGRQIPSGLPLAATVWAVVMVAALWYWRSGRGQAGLKLQLVRTAPMAASSIGIDAMELRRRAFLFGAPLAGLAGGLYAPISSVISPDVAEFGIMINVLIVVVLGGRRRVSGAILGALVLVSLPELLRDLQSWYLLAWGAALLAILIVAPDGLAGLLDAAWERLAASKEPEAAAAPGTAPTPTFDAVPTHKLEATDLHKSFGGISAVDGVSLCLEGGTIAGLIGPNGAGKSTLLNLFTGFVLPDSGKLSLDGANITNLPSHRRAKIGIARSFQTGELPDRLSALDAVAVAVPGASSLEVARQSAMTLLHGLCVSSAAARPIEALTPGTRRLIEIARALATRPAILVLDEPTAGLTVAERDTLARVLEALRRAGLAILVIEHDIAFVLDLTDFLHCMEAGRIVASGEPQSLRAQPSLKRFFGRLALHGAA